ncbi:MAG: site-2 protease family protein [Ruminococcus sp.]|nr:site-2 protease family protein [Ruminococcus sp.]
MSNVIGIVIAIIVFGVIVAIHEFGHFIVAKLCGIKVNKFAIGMGPVIFKHQGDETEYSLRLLPIGGFCAMEGEDENSTDQRAFNNKSIPKRFAVLVAGATMNIILGFLILIVTTIMVDKIPSCTVKDFRSSTASSQASGLQIGDKIISINGMHVFTDMDLSYKIGNTEDNNFTVVVLRDGEKVTLNNVKFYYSYNYYFDEATQTNVKVDDTYTGTEELKLAESRYDFIVEAVPKNPITVLSYSFRSTITTGRLIWISLIDLASGKYGVDDLSGPVGVVSAISEASNASSEGESFSIDWSSLLSLSSFLTINIGIFNLLPLPALDGGRILFLVVEAIRRKPIPREKEGLIHAIGLMLFFALMIFVTIQDIRRL